MDKGPSIDGAAQDASPARSGAWPASRQLPKISAHSVAIPPGRLRRRHRL